MFSPSKKKICAQINLILKKCEIEVLVSPRHFSKFGEVASVVCNQRRRSATVTFRCVVSSGGRGVVGWCRGGTCPRSPFFARRTPLRPRLWPSEGGKFGHAAEPYRGQRRAPDSPRPLEGPEESTRLPEAP